MKSMNPSWWEQFENIPFAVVVFSSQVGWSIFARPDGPKAAHDRYEAADFKKKMLLNYGSIVVEQNQ